MAENSVSVIQQLGVAVLEKLKACGISETTIKRAKAFTDEIVFERYKESSRTNRMKLPHADVDKVMPTFLKSFGVLPNTDVHDLLMLQAANCVEFAEAQMDFIFLKDVDGSKFHILAYGMVREDGMLNVAMAKVLIDFKLGPESTTYTSKWFLWFEWDKKTTKNYRDLSPADQSALDTYFKLKAARLLLGSIDKHALNGDLRKVLELTQSAEIA